MASWFSNLQVNRLPVVFIPKNFSEFSSMVNGLSTGPIKVDYGNFLECLCWVYSNQCVTNLPFSSSSQPVCLRPLTDCRTRLTNRRSSLSSCQLSSSRGERERFYLTTHSTHFIYGYMASEREKCFI